jgi:hypothetical protein
MTPPPAADRPLPPPSPPSRTARAQLTLVEHALCPLDTAVSLQAGSVFETRYFYTDPGRNRRQATARVGAAEGLSAHDELYLWGLLAVALEQKDPRPELMATPYYCLRRLGVVSGAKKGGREFELFRAALRRLAGVRYQNDHFYDPVRGEHRQVSFGLLSYSLPLDTDSSRGWHFGWDPVFFAFAQATGGALSFDLALYRGLDAASRRLYLFLKKLFWRSDASPELDLHHLAVDVLGFAPTIAPRLLKQKLSRCIAVLVRRDVLCYPPGVTRPQELFEAAGRGRYRLRLHRGAAFDRAAGQDEAAPESPLHDPLRSIGFDERSITRLLQAYPPSLLEQWADITLAARERQGEKFFRSSPQAYFIDNVREAAANRRTPPDWWRELRKQEARRAAESNPAGDRPAGTREEAAFEAYMQSEAREAFDRVTRQLVDDLLRAGQSESEARANAERMARAHLKNRFRQDHPEYGDGGFRRAGSLLGTRPAGTDRYSPH